MTRITLATDLKTRTGAPDKDARLTNCYVEVRGDQSVVRKRAIVQGGVSVGNGVAQGGIEGFVIYGDLLTPIDETTGTTWNSGTGYSIGDHVSVGFVDYWAETDNTNSDPTSNPDDWSTSYVPAVPFQGTYATWNPSDKAWNVTLFNGNLSASLTNPSSDAGSVRSTIGKSSGKWYWEITFSNEPHVYYGIATGLHDVANDNLGGSDYAWEHYTDFSGNTSYKAHAWTFTEYGAYGTVYGVGLDMDNGEVTFFVDGVSQGVAFSGLTGIIFPVIGCGNNEAFVSAITANFGASPFAYSVPSGYNSGLYTL